MKISSLAEDIVTAVYDHNGEGLTLQIDRNVISPSYMREVAKRLDEMDIPANGNKSKKKKAATNGNLTEGTVYEESATLLEKQTNVYSSLLSSHLIKSWDLTEEDGKTLIPIAEGLKRLAETAPMLVAELWVFAMDMAQTVKKTMPETTEDGLPATPLAQSMDAPTM